MLVDVVLPLVMALPLPVFLWFLLRQPRGQLHDEVEAGEDRGDDKRALISALPRRRRHLRHVVSSHGQPSPNTEDAVRIFVPSLTFDPRSLISGRGHEPAAGIGRGISMKKNKSLSISASVG